MSCVDVPPASYSSCAPTPFLSAAIWPSSFLPTIIYPQIGLSLCSGLCLARKLQLWWQELHPSPSPGSGSKPKLGPGLGLLPLPPLLLGCIGDEAATEGKLGGGYKLCREWLSLWLWPLAEIRARVGDSAVICLWLVCKSKTKIYFPLCWIQ